MTESNNRGWGISSPDLLIRGFMDIEQRENWAKIRKEGRESYVLKYGMLYWGMTTALLFSIATYFFMRSDPWFITPIIAFIVFPLFGVVFGLVTWASNEKKYRQKD